MVDGSVTTGSRRLVTGSRTHGKSLVNKQKGHFSESRKNRSREKRGWVEESGWLCMHQTVPFIGEKNVTHDLFLTSENHRVV